MADDFNLTPTNNLEKHLDNILRTAQGEDPQYDLAPNWRIEQYLAAIASALASGGGGSGGGVLEVTVDWDTADGTLDKTWQEIADAPMSIFKEDGYTYFCVFAKLIGAQYGVVFACVNTTRMAWENRYLFVASSASGYPAAFTDSGGNED